MEPWNNTPIITLPSLLVSTEITFFLFSRLSDPLEIYEIFHDGTERVSYVNFVNFVNFASIRFSA